RELKHDHNRYAQQHLILIRDNTNKGYRIGQRLLIEVARVSIEDRQIDFKLIETYPTDNKDLEHVISENKNRSEKKSRKPKRQSNNRQCFKQVAKQSSKGNNKKGKKLQIRKRKK